MAVVNFNKYIYMLNIIKQYNPYSYLAKTYSMLGYLFHMQ